MRLDQRHGAIEDRHCSQTALCVAIDIRDFRAQEPISLFADLVRGPVIDLQGSGPAADVHAQGLPGKGLLEDPLAQVAREEQGIGPRRAQRRQEAKLGHADVLGFVYHCEVEGWVFSAA
jgi:hypothetical protein